MPINRDKMKANLDNLISGKWFKGDEGKTYNMRLIDPGDGDPLHTHFMHYLPGGGWFICPNREYKEKCSLCDMVAHLYKQGYEQNVDIIRQLKVKVRAYSIIYVREQPDKGLQMWSYEGPTDRKRRSSMYDRLFEACMDPDYGDLTDPENGRDIIIKIVKQKYVMPEFQKVSGKASPLLTDRAKVAELLKDLPKIEDFIERKSSEEVAMALRSFLSDDNLSASIGSTSEKMKYNNTSPVEESSGNASNFDAAFDDMMNS